MSQGGENRGPKTMKAIYLPIALIASIISSFGSSSLSTSRSPHQPVTLAAPTAVRDITALPERMNNVRRKNSTASLLRTYKYVFSGEALHEDRPCPNARIELRVMSSLEVRSFHSRADENGRYRIAVSVQGEPNTALSWEITGTSLELQTSTVQGRQILIDEALAPLDVTLPMARL